MPRTRAGADAAGTPPPQDAQDEEDAAYQQQRGPDLRNLGLDDMDVTVPECEHMWDVELPESIVSLSLTPKGKLVAVAVAEDAIHIIDAFTGETKFTLPGHKGGTNGVAFLSGVVLASCGEDGMVRIWNCAHKTCTTELTAEGLDADRTSHGHTVTHLTVSPNGSMFAVAAGRNIVQYTVAGVEGASVAAPERRVFPALPSTVEYLKYCATNGNLMAAYNGGVTLWDLSTRKDNDLQGLDFPYDGACLSVDTTKEMDWVVAGCHDASVHIFQLIQKGEQGVEVTQMKCGGYDTKCTLTEMQPEGRWLASAGGAKATIWDFQDSPNGSIPTLTLGHRKNLTVLAWQPDEPGLLATCAKDGQVLLYNVEDIAVEGAPNLCLPGVAAPCPTNDDDEITAFSWAMDGFFFVGHVSGMVRGWQLPLAPDSSEEDESSSGEEEEEGEGEGEGEGEEKGEEYTEVD